jgi:hypothetical protein
MSLLIFFSILSLSCTSTFNLLTGVVNIYLACRSTDAAKQTNNRTARNTTLCHSAHARNTFRVTQKSRPIKISAFDYAGRMPEITVTGSNHEPTIGRTPATFRRDFRVSL